jgi:predicted Zn-dependent peptidase
MDSVRSVTGLLMLGVGSRYEKKRISGVSHFLEHMAFKGTKKRPSAMRIAEEIDSIGAVNNAFTGKEYTGYYIKSALEHLPMIVDMLADMMQNSLLKREDIENERGVILEEINMYEDMPVWKVGKNFEQLLYGGSSLGRRIIGARDTIKSLQREDFVDYMSRWYKPNNAVFAVAGGVGTLEKVKKLAKERFGEWSPEVDPADHFRVGIEKIDEKQSKAEVALEKKDTEQSHIVLGVRAFRREHPKRYALGVLATILGGGMSSRLFHEVREKRGLAYYISAGAQRYSDVGYLAARAGLDKGRIDEAIRVILSEFVRVRENRVGDKELGKAKEYLKGHLILSLEDSQEVAGLYAEDLLLEGKIRTPQEIINKIDAVTAQEVRMVARNIFVESKLNLAVIGPFGDRQKFEKLLQL